MASGEKRRGLPECGFAVDSTKKGGTPIKVESRAKGKKVTILGNVRGDGQLLCSTLSTLLGIGGTVLNQAGQQVIQLQGSQQERVTDALRELKCLRGVKEDEKPKKPSKQTEVASRHCAYDKFLRQESKPSLAKMLEGEAYAPKCLPGAECFRWHGHWVYCRGCCEQTDDNDVWEESARFCDPALERPRSEELLGAPLRPSCGRELDECLRKLGMLAEVGEAALTWGLRAVPGCAAAPLGTTLAEYRRMAVAPGARLLEYGGGAAARRGLKKPKEKVKASANLQAAARSKAPQVVPRVPQEEGNFMCPVCQNHFSLYKTLKTHMKLSHDLSAPPKHLVTYSPPKRQTLAVPKAVPRAAVRGRSEPRVKPKEVAADSGICSVRWGQKPPQQSSSQVTQVTRPKSEETVGDLNLNLASSFLPDPVSQEAVGDLFLDLASSFGCQREVDSTESPDVMIASTLVEDSCEECPICQQLVRRTSLQEHVEACLVDPAKTEHWEECPMCQEKFHPDAIHAHVQSCLDEDRLDDDDDDTSSEASDGIAGHPIDLNGYPVVRVRRAFRAGDATQVSLAKDDLFLNLWQQAQEDGGYWAWGCLVTWDSKKQDYYGVKLGYAPLSHLVLDNEDTVQSAPVAETPEAASSQSRGACGAEDQGQTTSTGLAPVPVRRWGRRFEENPMSSCAA